MFFFFLRICSCLLKSFAAEDSIETYNNALEAYRWAYMVKKWAESYINQILHRGVRYLMVPVGEGSGEPNALMCSSCCCAVGMLILRGEMWGRSGRGGGDGCSFSRCPSISSSDINWILITVLGKRNTHLWRRTAKTEGKDALVQSPLLCQQSRNMAVKVPFWSFLIPTQDPLRKRSFWSQWTICCRTIKDWRLSWAVITLKTEKTL